jgi:hypothetical protein
VVDDESAGEEPAAGARASLTPRERRARRRRRRRMLGVLIFVLVAAGILGVAYLAVAGPDDSSDSSDRASSTTSPSTTLVAPPAGPYRVTTGVNVRSGPGVNFPAVGVIETGHSVFASCVAEGDSVDGVTKWLRLTGFGPVGFLTVKYVDTGDDLNVPGKIPACAA